MQRRGRPKPSRPGEISILGMTFPQLLHCKVMDVALDLIPEAETMIPGILTTRETIDDCNRQENTIIF